MSNILKVFNPPSTTQTESPPPQDRQCVPCLVTSAAVMVLGGSYMASGAIFVSSKEKPLPKAATPAWRNVVRLGGVGIVCLGVVRGIEALMVASGEEKKLE